MTLRAVAVLATALGVAACDARPRTKPAPTARRPAAEYRLAVEDVVEITVWKEPQLSTTTPVRPDGRITVPAVGELRAAGRTTRDLEREIRVRLGRTLAAPVVSVTVKEIGARVYVIGEVAQPGAYPLRGALSVLQALALAGGLTEFADGDAIVVLRRGPDGRAIRIRFDYGEAIAGAAPLELQPGDTVVVP